jgi:hypothetical protein
MCQSTEQEQNRAERDEGLVEKEQKTGKSRYRGKEENRVNKYLFIYSFIHFVANVTTMLTL